MADYKKGGGGKQEAFDPKTGKFVKEGEGENNPPKKNLVFPTNKVKCIKRDEKKIQRDEANETCFQALENHKMLKEPKTYEDALEMFWKSCEVEHEAQVDNRFKLDETVVQPYTQQYIIPKILEKHWKAGHKVAIIYNPYNKWDIAGCDYIMFGVSKDEGDLTNNNPNLKVDYIDQKSNLSSLDKKSAGIPQGTKMNLMNIDLSDNSIRKKGFFSEQSKITSRYLFTIIRSDRVVDGKIKSSDEIDSSNNLRLPRKTVNMILKKYCGYKKEVSVDDFFKDIYDNKCNFFADSIFSLMNNANNYTQQMKEAKINPTYNKQGQLVKAEMPIGKLMLKTQFKRKENKLVLYLDTNFEKISESEKEMQKFFLFEEDGRKKYVENNPNIIENKDDS